MYWKGLTCEEQLRWVGPEKGAVHMAVGGIINALWDLWARLGLIYHFCKIKDSMIWCKGTYWLHTDSYFGIEYDYMNVVDVKHMLYLV